MVESHGPPRTQPHQHGRVLKGGATVSLGEHESMGVLTPMGNHEINVGVVLPNAQLRRQTDGLKGTGSPEDLHQVRVRQNHLDPVTPMDQRLGGGLVVDKARRDVPSLHPKPQDRGGRNQISLLGQNSGTRESLRLSPERVA